MEEPSAWRRRRAAGRRGAVPLAFLLVACATTSGEPPRIQGVDEFRVGVTMRVDAERLLGPAQYASEEPEGRTAFYWPLGPSGPAVPANAGRMVKLVFARDGRLARPAETVYPGRPGDPTSSGSTLVPAPPLGR